MYLTDVLDVASMDRADAAGQASPEFCAEQHERMFPVLKRVAELEALHKGVFGDAIPFSWALLRYIDYIIYTNTTGIKQ